MTTVILRKLGGSTVIALPPTFLHALNCRVGDSVELNLKEDKVELRVKRKKLSLKERLAMYEKALPLRTKEEEVEDQSWMNLKTVGRELL